MYLPKPVRIYTQDSFVQNYFVLIKKSHIFASQVRAHQVQSGDENFEGGLITALCVFRRYTITVGRNYLVERFALAFL
jgi:hypothetical protein